MSGNKKGGSERGNDKPRFSKIRGWVALAFFATVAIGLATHTATGTYSAFGFDQIAAICPVGALETLVTGAAPTWHVAVGIVVAIVVGVLFGKAFCSWICPTPWIQRLFGVDGKKGSRKVGKGDSPEAEGAGAQAALTASVVGAGATKVRAGLSSATSAEMPVEQAQGLDEDVPSAKKQRDALAPIGGERDGGRFDSRHGILLGALLSTAVFGFPVFCLVCPVGLTLATFIAIWHAFQFSEVTWGLIVFPAIVVLEVVVLRKWCHALCPLGALYSLLARGNKTFKPQVQADSCLRSNGVDCHTCVDVCPEKLDPHTGKIPECTKCGICVEKCPACAIDFKALLAKK